MKDYQASLHPLTLFLHLMHVVITIDFNELDPSYADSNEFFIIQIPTTSLQAASSYKFKFLAASMQL
ncbi:MAG: hypothetical protein M3270_03195 [Thermoproteota archaeon]|nr:hypothetical protein [Thermoproteota archaeon]